MSFATSPTVLRRFTLGLLCVLPLTGATLERLSFDDLVEKSTEIVRGRVSSSSDAFRGQLIYTHYRIEILERWKGPQQTTVEVMVPGGTVGGCARPTRERHSLYAVRSTFCSYGRASSGTTHIIGFTQGMFQLSKAAGQKTG